MSHQNTEVIEIEAADLIAEIQNGAQPILLDCRENWEWQRTRLQGSLHIPMNQIPDRLAELDRQREIVVICAHGQRSYMVTQYLAEQGFKARSLSGGLAAWPRP